MVMKATLCLATVICLADFPWQELVKAQTVVSVGSCDDLPSSPITEDTVLELTTSEISCASNTAMEVTEGASLEITSSEPTTNINNVKIWLRAGTFLCNVPMLHWTSVETVTGLHGFQVRGGAAMRTEEDTTATFATDVTFSECALPDEVAYGGSEGAAIANFGSLIFQGNTVFKDTPNAGALYTWGDVTFEQDAIFENNKSNGSGNGNGSGGALYIDFDGGVNFQGATSFVNNEVTEGEGTGGWGAALYSLSSKEEPMTFAGPVTVSGNSGANGAIAMIGSQPVVFESLVTLTDNVMEPKLYGDSSRGGAMSVSSVDGGVEFRGGVTATGNTAKRGGAFFFYGTQVTMSAPVTLTGNMARDSGGAIWMDESLITLPANADISGNTAIVCPGFSIIDSEVEFVGGDALTPSTAEDLCYLGFDTNGAVPEDVVEEFDCEVYSATAPLTNDHPYVVLNTATVKSWNFGSGGGFSCDTQLIMYITGGGELTIRSSSAASTLSNVHIEIVGYTSVVLDIPDLTMTGVYQSRVGGAVFVDVGSSLDIFNDITFLGNTIHGLHGVGIWIARGGAALFSAGTTTFHGRADFFGNGQYEVDSIREEPSNEDGGALSNSGTMTFRKRGRFIDNFNPNGGNGGAIANFGDMTFDLRAIFTNNSVGVAYTDDGEPYGGRGGAVFNEGENSTILFNGLALFKRNVGALGGCALASRGYLLSEDDDDLAAGDNKVVFASKAKFKDNYCDGDYPTIYSDRNDEYKGGGALLAYGITCIDFINTAVFKRNEAPSGGAIVNSAEMSFISDAKLFTDGNVDNGNCSDILNNGDGTISIGTYTFTGFSNSLCDRTSTA